MLKTCILLVVGAIARHNLRSVDRSCKLHAWTVTLFVRLLSIQEVRYAAVHIAPYLLCAERFCQEARSETIDLEVQPSRWSRGGRDASRVRGQQAGGAPDACPVWCAVRIFFFKQKTAYEITR